MQKPTWVLIDSNKVKTTSVEVIKDFVLNYLMDKRESAEFISNWFSKEFEVDVKDYIYSI